MTNENDIAIIGVGAFGENVLKYFNKEGIDVTILDKRRDVINHFTILSSNAIVGDSTDMQVLTNIGLQNYDYVLVCIGQDIKASILTTMHLLEMGVKNVIVKASDDTHCKILQKIGAHKIINPDKEMGERVAMQIVYNSVDTVYEINEYQSMAQLSVTKKTFANKSIAEIDFTNNYNIVVAIIKRGEEAIIPSATTTVLSGDKLFVIGEYKNIEKVAEII